MLRLMTAVLAPSDRTIRPVLIDPLIAIPPEGLDADTDDLIHGHYERFRELRSIWTDRGFMSMMRGFLDTYEARKTLLAQAGGERVLTNILHIAELIHNEETSGRLSPEAVLKWLNTRIKDPGNDEEFEIRLERDDEAARIVTTHASKGLEFPVVFCAFEWARTHENRNGSLTPYYDRATARRVLDLNMGDAAKAGIARETLAENIRLLYVAMTRARNLCYVPLPSYDGRGGGIHKTAFGYLAGDASPDDFLGGDVPKGAKAVFTKIKKLADTSKGTISLRGYTGNNANYQAREEGTRQLEARKFRRVIDTAWGMASFSALAKGHGYTVPDYRLMDEGNEPEAPAIPAGYELPKGANTGLAVHEVFERIDFINSDEWQRVITVVTRKYGMDTKSVGAVLSMVKDVLGTDVHGGLRLQNVGNTDCVKEMEFFYTLKPGGVGQIADIFRIHKKADLARVIRENVRNKTIHGFMNGFIDLMFRHDGKYYVLDWKTNFLGAGPDAYTADAVEKSMTESLYFLQYHIYVVAAVLFLKQRLPGFDFERDFGGVIYAYTRGMRVNMPEHSVFFERPDKALINDLTSALTGGGL